MQRYSTTILVLFFVVIQGGLLGVDAQTKLNFGGESACSLRDRLNGGSCGSTASKRDAIPVTNALQRREDGFTAKPSACTCNTPFFNIWSACELFELHSGALPLMKDWEANCTSASIAFTKDMEGTILGDTHIPKWALTKDPGDGTLFDVVGVVLAVTPKPWSTIQIILPLLSAIGALLSVAIIYLTCVRRGYDFTLFSRPSFHFLNSSRVQSEEPKNDWEIDKERMDQISPFPIVHRRSESINEVQIVSQCAFQPNRPAPHVQPPPIIAPEYPEEEEMGEVPLTSRWSDSVHTAPTPAPPSSKPKKTLVPKMLKSLPNPFKSRPVRVKPVAPKAGFRLDDDDARTASISTSNNAPVEEPDRRSVGSSMRDEDLDREERTTLISTEQRRENEVFLISKNGENFTISSGSTSVGMDVVSPTASSLTHSWRASGNAQIPPIPQLPPPRLPPPPKSPPPRVKQIISYDQFPLANMQDPSPSTHERSGSGSNGNSTRTLPVTVNQTGQPARPNLLHPPLRPVYESDTYPSCESLHQRSLSQTTPNVQAPYPMPLRRGLSEDDSSLIQLYSHSQDSLGSTPRVESTMQLRSGSRENLHPRRSDPSMLFPASVRSAGYFGSR